MAAAVSAFDKRLFVREGKQLNESVQGGDVTVFPFMADSPELGLRFVAAAAGAEFIEPGGEVFWCHGVRDYGLLEFAQEPVFFPAFPPGHGSFDVFLIELHQSGVFLVGEPRVL